jgi:hypothetical protein
MLSSARVIDSVFSRADNRPLAIRRLLSAFSCFAQARVATNPDIVSFARNHAGDQSVMQRPR